MEYGRLYRRHGNAQYPALELLENDMKLQPIRKEKLPRRNEKCPCGSGKKAKKCCLPSIKAFAALPQSVREQIVVARILSRPNTITVNGGTVATEDGIAVPVESGRSSLPTTLEPAMRKLIVLALILLVGCQPPPPPRPHPRPPAPRPCPSHSLSRSGP